MNPFAVFGLSPCFDFDSEQLTRTYRDLSRVVHPDRFGGASASERLRALNKAVDVNEAWRLLRDPLSRAEALLRHFDIAVEENKEPPASPALLLEMMDAREGLAEAKHGQDAAAV